MPRWSQPIAIGQRFSAIDLPSQIWEVQRVFTATDGIEYAMLSDVGDHTRRKTVSCWAIQESRLFRPAGEFRV